MYDLQHSFPGKDRREAIFVFVRPYFVAFLPTALIFMLIFAFSVVAQISIASGSLSDLSVSSHNLIVLGLGIFEMFVLSIFIIALMDFYNDILIVTDRRLVDIEQAQLFSRSIAELQLEDVEDVNSKVEGLFATIFGYGTVEIQTAGTNPNFISKHLRQPREIASIISDLSRQSKRDVPAWKRTPGSHIMGVINDMPIHNFESLVKVGAVTTDDPRRAPGFNASE